MYQYLKSETKLFSMRCEACLRSTPSRPIRRRAEKCCLPRPTDMHATRLSLGVWLKGAVQTEGLLLVRSLCVWGGTTPISFSPMLRRASAAIARRPVLAATTTFCGKYTVGDALVQHGTVEADGFDRTRLALFGGFGFYYGAVNYYVYRTVDRIKWGGPIKAAIGMSCFDIFVHLPFSFFPQFYVFKQVIFADPWPQTKAAFWDCAESGLGIWRANFVEDLKTLLYIFTPVDLAMFSLPQHLRVPFLSVAGLIFPVVLSWTRGERDEQRDP